MFGGHVHNNEQFCTNLFVEYLMSILDLLVLYLCHPLCHPQSWETRKLWEETYHYTLQPPPQKKKHGNLQKWMFPGNWEMLSFQLFVFFPGDFSKHQGIPLNSLLNGNHGIKFNHGIFRGNAEIITPFGRIV